MAELTVKDRVTEMVRDVLGPAMKASGFRRAGRVFWRDNKEVCHVVTVAMNRWGSRNASSFHVQLGVFWHRVAEILQNPSAGKMPPPEYRCTFRIDLGRTISQRPKPPWEVTQSSNFASLGREVLNDLRKYGLPWFEYRSDLQRTLEWKRFATPQGDGRHSIQELVSADAKVVFKVMLGKRKEAIADLKRYAKIGFPEEALRLGQRLGLPTSGIVHKQSYKNISCRSGSARHSSSKHSARSRH